VPGHGDERKRGDKGNRRVHRGKRRGAHRAGNGAPPPLAALSTQVIAVGSVSKVLWGGLRVGWIRVSEPLRSAVIARPAQTHFRDRAQCRIPNVINL